MPVPAHALRHELIELRQRVSRRLNPLTLEVLYQASYLDLARRTEWLQDPPLSSPGGGTASFSQLYVLLSLLREGEFTRALELGVGKSSAVLTQWAAAHGASTLHVDDDERWLATTVRVDDRTRAVHAPLTRKQVAGRTVAWYDADRPEGQFDLVLVDGPEAWARDARYNRLGVLDWIPALLADDFVVLVDDASRPGERELVRRLSGVLEDGGRRHEVRTVIGANSQTILVTPKYRFAAFL